MKSIGYAGKTEFHIMSIIEVTPCWELLSLPLAIEDC